MVTRRRGDIRPSRKIASLTRVIEENQGVYEDIEFDDDGVAHLVTRVVDPVVACFVEPIQGEGGVRPLTEPYLKALRAIADTYGFPLIFDEVQSGMGRVGTFLASEPAGVRGDYYVLSKALGGGLAEIGALLVQRDRYQHEFGYLHTSTFAEDDFASGVALAALDLIEMGGGELYVSVGRKENKFSVR